jgi:hypothetical protein
MVLLHAGEAAVHLRKLGRFLGGSHQAVQRGAVNLTLQVLAIAVDVGVSLINRCQISLPSPYCCRIR